MTVFIKMWAVQEILDITYSKYLIYCTYYVLDTNQLHSYTGFSNYHYYIINHVSCAIGQIEQRQTINDFSSSWLISYACVTGVCHRCVCHSSWPMGSSVCLDGGEHPSEGLTELPSSSQEHSRTWHPATWTAEEDTHTQQQMVPDSQTWSNCCFGQICVPSPSRPSLPGISLLPLQGNYLLEN